MQLSAKALQGKPFETRRDIVLSSLRIPSLDLIVDKESLLTRSLIDETAARVYNAALKLAPSYNEAASVITAPIIASLLLADDDYTKACQSIWRAVDVHYGSDAKRLADEKHLDVSGFVALREYTVATNSAYDYLDRPARQRAQWRGRIDFSSTDILRGIQVPHIDKKAAFMIGAASVAGTFHAGNGAGYSIHFKYSPQEFPESVSLTQKVLVPIIQHHFHIPNGEYENQPIKWFGMDAQEPTTNLARGAARFYSKAMYTFFTNALALSSTLKGREFSSITHLPESVHWDTKQDLSHAMLAGILSMKLRIAHHAKRTKSYDVGYFYLGDCPELGRGIVQLAADCGLKFTRQQSNNKIYIGQEELPYVLSRNPSLQLPNAKHAGYIFRAA